MGGGVGIEVQFLDFSFGEMLLVASEPNEKFKAYTKKHKYKK